MALHLLSEAKCKSARTKQKKPVASHLEASRRPKADLFRVRLSDRNFCPKSEHVQLLSLAS